MAPVRLLIALYGAAAAAASPPDDRQLKVVHDAVLANNWQEEVDLHDFVQGMIDASEATEAPTTAPPTKAPTPSPTTSPTVSPTAFPSELPSSVPSNAPTTSSMPSGSPSAEPTPSPSMAPSVSAAPTAFPTVSPSEAPSDAPSTSSSPSASPTGAPSSSPSVTPSSQPTLSPTDAPSSPPSSAPTEQPTLSSAPSEAPTEAKVIASSIIIDRSNTRSSTPLLIVGACCVVALASTGAYLYRRGQLDKRRRNPAMIEVDHEKDLNGVSADSPYSVEKGLGQSRTFDVNFTESESRISEDGTLDYGYTAKEKRFDADGEMVDVDLESGQDAVPSSVAIIRNPSEVTALEPSDEKEPSGFAKLRLPKSIYIPKIFKQRSKEGDEPKKEAVTWNQIREEDHARSSCSSGYAPASAPSPMFSPFFVKGMSMASILSPRNGFGKRVMLTDEPSEDELVDVDESAPVGKKARRNGCEQSPMKEIVVTREAPSKREEEAFAGEVGLRENPSGDQSAKSSESSIEWGIDVSKVPPSKASFEDNVAELQDLLVSIQSLGSQERASGAEEERDVQMTYTEDSSEGNVKSVGNSLPENASPKSETSPSVGEIDICPIESASTSDDASTRGVSFGIPSASRNADAPGITFGRELMNSGRKSEEGTFSFRNIVSDPNNDLYECRAPSGPLGVVVDTTPLGPRVRSLNPLSPIFGQISPGDVVVGVDEVDTVGMEAGEFWKVVSRKANQQVRVLTVLRI